MSPDRIKAAAEDGLGPLVPGLAFADSASGAIQADSRCCPPLRSVGAAEGGLTPPGAASHYGLACETVAVQLAAPERSG